MLASRKKKSKKSPVRRSVKPKSIKSSRSKTVRPAKPKSIKSSRSVKPKKTRPANIARATGTGNGISSIMESTKMISKEIKTISKIFIDNHRILESTKTMISTLSNTGCSTLTNIPNRLRYWKMIPKNSSIFNAAQKADLVSELADIFSNALVFVFSRHSAIVSFTCAKLDSFSISANLFSIFSLIPPDVFTESAF